MSHTFVKQLLEDALLNKKSLLIGKIGTIECTILHMISYLYGEVPEEYRLTLEKNAGVFPSDSRSIILWARESKEALRICDALAVGWYENTRVKEQEVLKNISWSGHSLQLRSLEPYYANPEERWTSLLKDQSVCIVTSFTQSAQKQVGLGESKIWPGANGTIWPSSTKWSWVQTGYAPVLAKGRAGWEESPESYSDAINWVVQEVLKTEARIVLIGCGGLGLLIGAKLKGRGKICIVLGGAIQVLFGIKGRRWENHSIIKNFWNASWSWPSQEEIPSGAEEVEKSCYWK